MHLVDLQQKLGALQDTTCRLKKKCLQQFIYLSHYQTGKAKSYLENSMSNLFPSTRYEYMRDVSWERPLTTTRLQKETGAR